MLLQVEILFNRKFQRISFLIKWMNLITKMFKHILKETEKNAQILCSLSFVLC